MVFRAELGFALDAFDSTIQIECANAEICEMLQRYIFPPIRRSNFEPRPDIRLRVEQNADGFRVLLNNEVKAGTVLLSDAALAAVKALDDSVVHRMKSFRAVHAGAVLIEGRALIIPGSSHAGKSSLVAELLSRGASHFSDEYALIDKQGKVHSYPRPLLLRNGAPLQSLTLPQELNSAFARGPASVGWIVALEYAPGASWHVRAISQSEGVMLLLRHTPHELAQSPEMINFFLGVSSSAACYTGQRGEAAEAASRILELIHQN